MSEHPLIGRLVRVTLSRAGIHGTRYGMVRAVETAADHVVGITMQEHVGAERSTIGARYRGRKFRVRNGELTAVYVRTRGAGVELLADWLAGLETRTREVDS